MPDTDDWISDANGMTARIAMAIEFIRAAIAILAQRGAA